MWIFDSPFFKIVKMTKEKKEIIIWDPKNETHLGP